MKPLQLGSVPIIGQQAPTVGLQAGTIPGTTAMQIDFNSMMNMMIYMMMMVMVMGMMSKAVGAVG